MNAMPLLLAGVLTAGGTAGPELNPIQISTEHYELDLRVDYSNETLQGTARMSVRNVGASATSTLPFLLYRLMEVSAVRDAGGHALRFDQDIVRFEDFDALQVNWVEIRLPEPLSPGEATTVEVDYAGRLLGYSETGMLYVRDHIDPTFTMLRNDAYAFPTVGVPSSKLNHSAPPESYDYVARITVPDSLFVANGGRLVERGEANGLATFVYHSIRPSWRMDFGIGHYGLLEHPPLRVLYLREDSAGAKRLAEAGEACFRLFTGWFGPLEDTPTITLLEIPDGWGSQKDVTTIIQTAAAFRDPTRYHELYHELAHLWQPAITDKPSPRWNEGLASFLEMLAAQKLDGRQVVDQRADQIMTWLRKSGPEHPDWTEIPMIDYGKTPGMTDLSYSVGEILFDLLYRLAGPAAFNQALKGYYHRFAADGGSTAELQAAFTSSSSVDLGPVFRDWLYTTRWHDALGEASTIQDLTARYRHTGS